MINNKIMVSIITPVYNGEKTIEKTIESVLNQTYKNIEYIIVDGKSSDKTLEIIKNKLQKNVNMNVKVISEKDTGIYNAMNKGILNSTGEILGIINADDWYELNAVEKIIENYNISAKKNRILYYDLNIYKDEELIKIWKIGNVDLKKRMIPHPTIFIPRKIYENYGVFKEKYRINADWELLLRLNTKKDIEFKKIETPIANFRVGGVSSEYTIERLINSFKAYKENLNIFLALYYFIFYGTRNYISYKILKKKG